VVVSCGDVGAEPLDGEVGEHLVGVFEADDGLVVDGGEVAVLLRLSEREPVDRPAGYRLAVFPDGVAVNSSTGRSAKLSMMAV
jgi:hypothetical protein